MAGDDSTFEEAAEDMRVSGASGAVVTGARHGAVPVALPDLLPIDRKVFGHPHRNIRTVDDLLKSVTAQRMEECGNVHVEALRMHGGSVWQWGHLKPRPVSVAVVTPGRLVHHVRELGHSWLANLEMLVTCPGLELLVAHMR